LRRDEEEKDNKMGRFPIAKQSRRINVWAKKNIIKLLIMGFNNIIFPLFEIDH
jgi:hypothetical protein